MSVDGAIFLSAGVPDPTKAHFISEGDSAAIAAAVSALLYVTLGRRRLVWGGHPSITPMIWACAETMDVDYGAWVKLYQSLSFQDEFPEETAKFKNVVFTDKVVGDAVASLRIMRERMLDETNFDAAVFVGGMQGILDEYILFSERAPDAAIIPIVSTGGAAATLGEQIHADPTFSDNLDYVDLLYLSLGIHRGERRYRTPEEQPSLIQDRLMSGTSLPGTPE